MTCELMLLLLLLEIVNMYILLSLLTALSLPATHHSNTSNSCPCAYPSHYRYTHLLTCTPPSFHHSPPSSSPQDPTKVDRSGAYIARQAAKSVVAAGLARRCLVQVSYAIGVPEPLSVFVDTYGTGTIPDADILAKVGGQEASQAGAGLVGSVL